MTDYSLSAYDVQKVAGAHIPIYKYSEIQKYKTLKELLGGKQAIILLYEWRENMGHWCCVFRNSNGYNFFDSFGYVPDGEEAFIPENTRKKFGLDRHLSYLLATTNLPIQYNEFVLQDDKASTCGRWVGYRLRNRKQDEYQFIKPFEKYADEGIDIDKLIIEMTDKYLK